MGADSCYFRVLFFIFFIFSDVAIVPVLASFAVAYLLNPIVHMSRSSGISRTMSAIDGYFAGDSGYHGFLAYVVPDLWSESTKAGSRIAENFTPGKRQAAAILS